MSIDTKTEDALRGQPFIGKEATYVHPKSIWQRVCGRCFYRYGRGNYHKSNPDCDIVVDPTPHKRFGFKEDEYLPEQIDGKEVGNYCPHFSLYDYDGE